MRFYLLISIGLLGFASCKKTDTIPLPRAYPRVELPVKEYVVADVPFCPVGFDIPVYSEIRRADKFFGERADHPCWFDLHFPGFNGDFHCSYKELQGFEDFEKSVSDAFLLSNKHVKRADYIDEIVFRNENRVSGILFVLDGPTATPAQFFATDSVKHFFRASLYLNTAVNRDSTLPIYDFLMVDLERMIASLKWKD